jgi:metal transporter CNNM
MMRPHYFLSREKRAEGEGGFYIGLEGDMIKGMEWDINVLIWLGIFLCLTQSATFSGLNLALFGLSRLRLEVGEARGNEAAAALLEFRRDSNFLLATILWGNVSVNVLLTILSDSVLTGVGAFFFSTLIITSLGEVAPQAYFSRHALRMVSHLAPFLKVYQVLLYPIVKPTSLILDAWLGREGIDYYREEDLHEFLKKHIAAPEQTNISRIEGVGAQNFLRFDDLTIAEEGERVDPRSIIQLPAAHERPVLPPFERSITDPFVRQMQASGLKWVILTNQADAPLLALDSEAFLRGLLFGGESFNPYNYCHRPLVITNPKESFARVLPQLKVQATHAEDDVIDHDIILLWAEEKRVITGSDILGRLLRGIVDQTKAEPAGSGRP